MPSYTITEVMLETREWKSRDGTRTFVSHAVHLEGQTRAAEFSRPLGGTAPVVGQVLEGYELKDKGNFPPELRKQGSGGRGNGGGGGSFQRDPTKDKQIAHLACLKVAVEHVRNMAYLKMIDKTSDEEVNNFARRFREFTEQVQ